MGGTKIYSTLLIKLFLLSFGKGNQDQNVYEPLDKKVIFELSKFSFAEAKQTPTTSKLIKLIKVLLSNVSKVLASIGCFLDNYPTKKSSIIILS